MCQALWCTLVIPNVSRRQKGKGRPQQRREFKASLQYMKKK